MRDIFLILLFCLVPMLLSIVAFSLNLGISPMPISVQAKKKFKEHLPQLNSDQGTLVELGSGWGGVALMLAKKYPHLQVVAFELSYIPWIFSCFHKFFSKCPNLHFLRKDFRKVSLKNVSLVFCYLFPQAMEALNIKFRDELPEGAYIVSFTFSLPTWNPEIVIKINDLYNSSLFFYRKAFAKA